MRLLLAGLLMCIVMSMGCQRDSFDTYQDYIGKWQGYTDCTPGYYVYGSYYPERIFSINISPRFDSQGQIIKELYEMHWSEQRTNSAPCYNNPIVICALNGNELVYNSFIPQGPGQFSFSYNFKAALSEDKQTMYVDFDAISHYTWNSGHTSEQCKQSCQFELVKL